MNKYILLLNLFCVFAIGQTRETVLLTYKVITLYDTNDTLKDAVAQNFRKTKPLEYSLLINGDESLFYQNEVLGLDNIDLMALNMRKVLSSSSIQKVYSKGNELFIIKNALQEDFLIKKELNSFDWKLLNETKLIDGDKCFKATIQVQKINRDGSTIMRELIAYYNPKYQWHVGPFGFGNLPGLIVELVGSSTQIILTKINPSTNEVIHFDVNKIKNLTTFSSDIEFEKFIFDFRKKNR